MANNNTKSRNRRNHKAQRSAGFPKPVFKKKAKQFPRPNATEDLSIRAQSLIYHGVNSPFTKTN